MTPKFFNCNQSKRTSTDLRRLSLKKTIPVHETRSWNVKKDVLCHCMCSLYAVHRLRARNRNSTSHNLGSFSDWWLRTCLRSFYQVQMIQSVFSFLFQGIAASRPSCFWQASYSVPSSCTWFVCRRSYCLLTEMQVEYLPTNVCAGRQHYNHYCLSTLLLTECFLLQRAKFLAHPNSNRYADHLINVFPLLTTLHLII